jgi:hypothetical protein
MVAIDQTSLVFRRWAVSTNSPPSYAFMRFATSAIQLPHGAQKIKS